jgi:hypothetical protein
MYSKKKEGSEAAGGNAQCGSRVRRHFQEQYADSPTSLYRERERGGHLSTTTSSYVHLGHPPQQIQSTSATTHRGGSPTLLLF